MGRRRKGEEVTGRNGLSEERAKNLGEVGKSEERNLQNAIDDYHGVDNRELEEENEYITILVETNYEISNTN